MAITKSLAALAAVALLGTTSAQSTGRSNLVAQRMYWNATLGDFAMISVCTDTAAMAAVDGDLIRAARALAYGEKFSDRIATALRQLPAGWRAPVGPHLTQASLALAAAGNALRLYFAHTRVTDLKTAQTEEARAATELVAATSEAKAAYARIGGDAADLETLPHAIQAANIAFATAMGDTDTDDQ